ncbi:MAG: protease HtpX, partial [Proteobacteria bacterium]|nr:protease HtpX [Pseudomonadota bacterium]
RMDGLFSTHPDPRNRIEALKQFAQQMGNSHASTGPWTAVAQERDGPWG